MTGPSDNYKRKKQQRPSARGSKGGSESGDASDASITPPTVMPTRVRSIAPPAPRKTKAIVPPGTMNNHTMGGSIASKAVMAAANGITGGSPASRRVMRGAVTPLPKSPARSGDNKPKRGGRGLTNIVGDTIAQFYKSSSGSSAASGSKTGKSGGGDRDGRKKRSKGGNSETSSSNASLSRLFVTDNKNKPIPKSTPAPTRTKQDIPLPASATQPGSIMPPRMNDRTYLPKSTNLPTGQPFSISNTPLVGVKQDFSTSALHGSNNPRVLRI